MNDKTWKNTWPLERALFLMAGTLILVSALLAATVSEWFLLLTAFVGANELLYATRGFCGASLILSRFAGLKPATATRGDHQ